MPSNQSAPAHSQRPQATIASRVTVAATLIVSLVVTCGITYWLYTAMQRVFRQGIDERLMGLASIATTHFDPVTLDAIAGSEDISSAPYRQTVLRLQQIRSQARNVKYIYILRRTSDPNMMEFVADADSLTPDIPVDLNGDGVIDEADALTYPGDLYDVSEYPEFREAAFVRPFVDPEFTEEQWGTLLAGTAPIFSPAQPQGPTDYVIGVDLDVTEFRRLLDRVLLPFLAFIAFLLALITGQTVALRHFWNAQVRQLEEIDRQKDELLSIVSHQLGGPIAAIRWGLEGLHDDDAGELSQNQRQEVEQIMTIANGLRDLVNLLLDLSRIELGRLSVDKKPLDLAEFFREIEHVIRVFAQQKGIELAWNVPKDLPTATIDRRLTHMTLENLLNNAVKYTPQGGHVSFTVYVRNGRLHCEVRDTGVGIPKEDQKQLFTKLFQAGNVRGTIEGNGFGLYIAKGAMEQQGGTIRCESAVGRGTAFTVELPI